MSTAVEKIYAEMMSRCMCVELMEDDDPCGALCPFCEGQKKRPRASRQKRVRAKLSPHPPRSPLLRSAPAPPPPPPPPANPWKEEIDFLRTKLTEIECAAGTETKLPIARELFTALLGFRPFLAAHKKLRDMTRLKAAELITKNEALPIWGLLADVLKMLAEMEI